MCKRSPVLRPWVHNFWMRRISVLKKIYFFIFTVLQIHIDTQQERKSYISDNKETSCTCNKCPKCSLLPVNQAWDTQGWDNPGTLDRLINYTDYIWDLWTSTGANNTFHKWASESWESTARRQPVQHHLCTINKWFWIRHFLEDSFLDFKTKNLGRSSENDSADTQGFGSKMTEGQWMTWGSQVVKHPMNTNWLQFLLEWPSARVVSATKIPKLVWPCGHIWAAGALSKSLCSKPARAAQLRLLWPCSALPSASSHRANAPAQAPSQPPWPWHCFQEGLSALLFLEHRCGVLPDAKCLIQNKSRQDLLLSWEQDSWGIRDHPVHITAPPSMLQPTPPGKHWIRMDYSSMDTLTSTCWGNYHLSALVQPQSNLRQKYQLLNFKIFSFPQMYLKPSKPLTEEGASILLFQSHLVLLRVNEVTQRHQVKINYYTSAWKNLSEFTVPHWMMVFSLVRLYLVCT